MKKRRKEREKKKAKLGHGDRDYNLENDPTAGRK
jgi:hypothetical protein